LGVGKTITYWQIFKKEKQKDKAFDKANEHAS